MRLALITLALLVLYHGMRLLAATCNGSGCDWFIPFSLLLPLAIFIMVGVTGLDAIAHSRASAASRRPLVGALAAIGFLGPIVVLFVFRDRPDAFVWTSTLLISLLPAVVIAFWLADRRGHSPAGDPS